MLTVAVVRPGADAHPKSRSTPGYVSANIHRSLDGTKIVNYAQWRRAEDLEAMLANPEAGSHPQEANELARSEAGLYEVVFTHSSS